MQDIRYNSVQGSKIKQNLALSTSPRFHQHIPEHIPGPGAYVPSTNSTIGVKFALNKRSSFYKHPESPSPGAYNIPSCFDNKKSFSFSPKLKKTEQKTPGPGSYDPKDVVFNTRRAVFGHEKRRDNFLDPEQASRPAPNIYSLASTLSGPKWRFGSELSRKPFIVEDFPGPGAYNSPSTLSKHFHKFPSSRQTPKLSSNPGPGHYNADGFKVRHSFAISRAEKLQKLAGPFLPGPSDYTIRAANTLTPNSCGKFKNETNTSSTLLSDLSVN